ncbi:MAG TPA: ClpXP protease specificity-enhancing factor [Gammaproteobacteria bacterium]|nr:ClpXP protease specificity-enhancing factor [Gammaproteobacteria bacterium]|tara:strand:+ start:1957 stop:2382 length:426 start_codon:yes stop_codon:yes gene_type:complete
MVMTSSRPYVVRALYEWIVDNNCTPYILVNAFEDGVEVPQEHVRDGQIVLNISPVAVSDLHLGNGGLNFEGRFGGVPKIVSVPMVAVCGIYAKENGQGMIFDPESTPPEPPEPKPTIAEGTTTLSPADKGRSFKPSLRIVK